MPPRKSDISKAGTGDEATAAKEALVRDGINIEDLNLPKSIVTRLAKGVLPPNTQIQGNAMLAMTKSATVFVNYLASHSNEHASAAGRKTINPQDVFNALEDLEFPDFRPRLEAELAKFNEVQADKRNAYRTKVAESKAAAQTGHGDDGDAELGRDGQPATKKARLEPGDNSEMDASEMPEGYNETSRADDDGEDDEGHGDEEEDDDEEPEEPDSERLEVEEPPEEADHVEAEDEALDNGDDSD